MKSVKSEPLSEFSGPDANFQLSFGCSGSDFSILTADFDEFGVDFQVWMPLFDRILDVLGRISRF